MVVLAVSSGCASAVENPSAYESERFLCEGGARSEFDARLARCRTVFERDGSCGGVASYEGILEGQPVTVDTELTQVVFLDYQTLDRQTLRDEVTLGGASPYFRFSFVLKEQGNDMSGAADGSILSIGTPSVTATRTERLSDGLIAASLRITVGGDSVDFQAESGSVEVERQTAAEQAASFDVGFDGDELRGCFHAFATDRRFARQEASAE